MKEYREYPDFISQSTQIIRLGDLNIGTELIDDWIPTCKRSNQNVISNGFWLNQKGNLKYFKVPITNYSIIKELLGVKISEYFTLPTIHYQIADGICRIDQTEYHVYGLLSEWARKKDCQYMNISQLISNNYSKNELLSYNDDDISLFHYLDKIIEHQPFTEQLRAFLVREFFTQETDRQEDEVLLEIENGKIELAYLLDYEMEWVSKPDKSYKFHKKFNLDPDSKTVVCQIQQDNLIQEQLYKAMDIDVIKLLSEVEEEYCLGLTDYDRQYFGEQAKEMKQYIIDKKLI